MKNANKYFNYIKKHFSFIAFQSWDFEKNKCEHFYWELALRTLSRFSGNYVIEISELHISTMQYVGAWKPFQERFFFLKFGMEIQTRKSLVIFLMQYLMQSKTLHKMQWRPGFIA